MYALRQTASCNNLIGCSACICRCCIEAVDFSRLRSTAACSGCYVESVLKRFSSSVYDLRKVKRLHICASRRFDKIRTNSNVFLAAARAPAQPCIVLESMHVGLCYLGLLMQRCFEHSTECLVSRTVSTLPFRSPARLKAFSTLLGLKYGQDYDEGTRCRPNLATGAEGKAEAMLPQAHEL